MGKMSNEILYYLIIFGGVILAGVIMLILAIQTLKTEKKDGM